MGGKIRDKKTIFHNSILCWGCKIREKTLLVFFSFLTTPAEKNCCLSQPMPFCNPLLLLQQISFEVADKKACCKTFIRQIKRNLQQERWSETDGRTVRKQDWKSIYLNFTISLVDFFLDSVANNFIFKGNGANFWGKVAKENWISWGRKCCKICQKEIVFHQKNGEGNACPIVTFWQPKIWQRRRSPLLSPKTQWNGGTTRKEEELLLSRSKFAQKCNFTFYTSKVPQLPSKKFKWAPGCQNWDFLRRLVIEDAWLKITL